MQSATITAKRSGRKRSRWIILAILVVVLAAGAVIASNAVSRIRDARDTLLTQTGEASTAFIGDLSASATASGQIEPVQTARLSAGSPGVVQEVLVRAGDAARAGEILVQLDTRALDLRVERASQNLSLQELNLQALLEGSQPEDIAAAEASVRSAQIRLDNLLAGVSAQDLAEAEANIRAQQANVAAAAASYNGTLNSVSSSAVAAARIDVMNAQAAYDSAKEVNDSFANSATDERLVTAERNLAIAQAALDKLLAGPNRGAVTSAASSVTAAQANLEQTEANTQKLLAGATPSQIASAESALAQAKSNLANLTAAAVAEDVAIAEAGVNQARLALQDAEERLAQAAVVAPFDGVVTAVNVTEGEYASGPLVELVSHKLQVVLSVDEVDVGALSPGQPAVITLETRPDVEIESQITAIAPSANSGSGAVSYDVILALAETDLPVRVGMTANAQLITDSHENVLLVPNAAITADRNAGTYTVNRINGTVNGLPTIEKTEVTIGLKDSQYTQIISGLSEGDELIVGELVVPTGGFGPRDGGPFGG